MKLYSKSAKRSIFRTISSGSSFGENPNIIHIGIKEGEEVEKLNIIWPGGIRQSHSDIQIGMINRITEGDQELRTDPIKSIKLTLDSSHKHNH